MEKGKYGAKVNGGGGGAAGGGSSGQSKKMCQVFLRNLPLAMLEPDIETMLQDCGPIKRIDLIKTTDAETRAKSSRGFGFVTFALEADASKAVNTIHAKRVMGREISCEIALKKGAKREGNGRDKGGQTPSRAAPPPDSKKAGGGEAGAGSTTYGGGGAVGEKKETAAATPKAAQSKVPKTKHRVGEEGAGGKAAAPIKTQEEGDGAAVAKGKISKTDSKSGGPTLPAGASGEAGAGLSKKEARKLARKAMKKELVKKAKERAKDKKEAQAIEDAAAVAKAVKAAPSAGAADGEAEAEEEAVKGEPLDPKSAKLMGDAQTLLIFGVADDLTAKQLQKRVKKYATVSALTLEENDRRYFPAGKIARVVCAGKEGTRKIITGIDGHTVHGQTLKARRLMEIVPGHDVRQQKQQRLIVRNLNFHAKEEDLAKVFSEFGPLAEVHIPTVRVTSQKRIRGTDDQETVTENRSRGFGFVQFLCPRDAARVVKDHGVLKISGRDAAVDYSITKEKFNALKQQTVPTATPKDSDPEDDNDDENSDGSEQEDGMEVDTDGESESDDSDGELSDGDSKEKAGEGEEGGGAGAGLGRAAVEEKKQRASDVQQGCTIFVRNVAFDCGQEEVKERLSEFGNVRLALLVKDRATGMPRGTAFVKFSKREEADRCLAAAMGATDPAHARDSGGSCIYLGSRAMHITRAVDREEAGRLTVGAQKRAGHKDKRNLYLADEGLVIEDSGAAEGAAKSDMEKRVLARRDKKSKLKNPIFFVSPVRLSVRNLARHVTDAKLKAMAVAAARSGIESGRSNPQDVRRYLEAQGEEFAAITPKRLQIPKAITGGSVVKTKIIRDMDKKPSPDDPSELHPSKGYGFVEFAHHGHALAALRHMNNNPAFSGQARSEGVAKGETSRLIVEFSVENHAKLKLQQSRKEAFEQRKQELKALGLGQDGRPMDKKDQDKEKKSRGKIQREKKKLQAESTDKDDTSKELLAEQSADANNEPSKKKRKKSASAKVQDSDMDGEGQGAEDNNVVVSGDPEVDGLVGGGGAEGEDRPKRKKKKKISPYERVDSQEHAYQKLERAYMAKTELAAEAAKKSTPEAAKSKGKRRVEAMEGGGEEGAEGARVGQKKGKAGRWFD